MSRHCDRRSESFEDVEYIREYKGESIVFYVNEFKFSYDDTYDFYPGKMYLSNGDPGYPDEYDDKGRDNYELDDYSISVLRDLTGDQDYEEIDLVEYDTEIKDEELLKIINEILDDLDSRAHEEYDIDD